MTSSYKISSELFNVKIYICQGMSFDDRFTNVNDEIAGENIPLIATTEQPYRVIRTTAFIVLHIILVVSRIEID